MTGFCGWYELNPGSDAAAGRRAAGPDALLADLHRAAGWAGAPAPVVAQAGLFVTSPAGPSAAAAPTLDTNLALVGAGDGVVLVLSEPVTSPGQGGRVGAGAVLAGGAPDAEALLGRVHGPFALALACPGHLTLAIDRAGVRPLWWLEQAGAVWFSTRLAALTAVPGFAADIDDQALFDYLYFHMVPSPGSIWRGVRKLLPGQCMEWSRGRARTRFYWTMPYRDDNPAPFGELKQTFRDLLPRVVADAVAGAAQPGCFLSGGTDSSTVAGTFQQLRAGPVPTYSIGFAAEGFDEMGFARIAAEHFGTRAREYYVSADDLVAAIPAVAAYCDEPFANASIVPAHICARFARSEGITRLLAGDGGDEIFGGNERYATQSVFEVWGRVPGVVRGLVEPAVRLPGLSRLAPVRKAQSYIAQARVPLPDRFNTYNFLHRTPLPEIFTDGFLDRVDTGAPLANLREVYGRTASTATINRMMHLDLKITLADNDLRKVNQACELAGVEVVYPLLDDRMMTFAAAVPPGMQLRGTRLRWFFKQALRDFLPPETIRKRKQGFGTPVGLWMTEHAPLRDLTGDSLSALRRRGILRPEYIDWVLRQHGETHASYYGVMLWVLVMLEQWLRARGR